MVAAGRGAGEQQRRARVVWRRDPKAREGEAGEVPIGEATEGGVGGGEDVVPMDILETQVEGRVGVS